MPTLAQAPLVEVATQIRWGVADRDPSGVLRKFVFSDEEYTSLLDSLEDALADAGFVHVERFAPELEDVPFAVSRRYRQGPDEWPVIQTGLGVFAVHQENDGYDWRQYRAEVLQSMDLVTEALSAYYTQVPFIGAELTYIDAFSFESGETPLQFFTKKLAVQFQLPQPFLEAPFVEQEPSSASLSFEFQITDPVGSLTLSLDHAELIERPGYVMDTRVRSLGSALTYSPEGLTDWLESAHRVQQHAFNTIIKPAYHESFQ